jgi:Helix-turn-helix domain
MNKKSTNAAYFQSENGYDIGEQKHAHLLFENLIWLTTEEARQFLRKKTTHAVRQMLYKGKIRARKFDGRLYFKRTELHRHIDSSFY